MTDTRYSLNEIETNIKFYEATIAASETNLCRLEEHLGKWQARLKNLEVPEPQEQGSHVVDQHGRRWLRIYDAIGYVDYPDWVTQAGLVPDKRYRFSEIPGPVTLVSDTFFGGDSRSA